MRCVRLQFKYIDWTVSGSEGRPKTLIEDGEKLIEIRHDEATESELAARLQELGFMPYRRIENNELLYVAPGNDAGQSSIGL